MRYSYLGPRGTFTQAALNQIASEEEAEHVPAIDVPAALEMVRSGRADFAVVPIENSVEGGVNSTLDALSQGTKLQIVAEKLVPITFSLGARPGTDLSSITRIGTHPHAWAQCRRWIHDQLGDVEHVPTQSTSAAAKMLSEGTDDFDAALCSALSVEQYGLEALASSIADRPDAVTRFICVGHRGPVGEQTGADKTTMQVELPSDESGALLTMLEQFATRGVNLSRIESRPVGDALGRYSFSIDCEGHIRDERVQAAIIGLHRTCPKVHFLGSYASADLTPIIARPGTTDNDFIEARAWIDRLLEGTDE